VLYFSIAASENPNPAQRMREPRLPRALLKKRLLPFELRYLLAIGLPQLRFGIAEDESSFPTESSTPLMNWTDSGAENLRAISSASLITTGLGV